MTATDVQTWLDEATIAELQPPCEELDNPNQHPAEYALRGHCQRCGKTIVWLLCGLSTAYIRASCHLGIAFHTTDGCRGLIFLSGVTRIGGNPNGR